MNTFRDRPSSTGVDVVSMVAEALVASVACTAPLVRCQSKKLSMVRRQVRRVRRAPRTRNADQDPGKFRCREIRIEKQASAGTNQRPPAPSCLKRSHAAAVAPVLPNDGGINWRTVRAVQTTVVSAGWDANRGNWRFDLR